MDGGNNMRDIKSAVERLQAEMEWVKVVLGQRPQDTGKKTSPPWLGSAVVLAAAILPAIIVSKPWG